MHSDVCLLTYCEKKRSVLAAMFGEKRWLIVDNFGGSLDSNTHTYSTQTVDFRLPCSDLVPNPRTSKSINMTKQKNRHEICGPRTPALHNNPKWPKYGYLDLV